MLYCLQIVLVFLVLKSESAQAVELNDGTFADTFLFGAATASYQVEGAWNESDKSEDIWNYMTHNYPEEIRDRSNGDVACDSYHHIKDDVAMLVNLGVDFYRFSLAWTRLLPTGFDNKVSEDGLAYYNNLINALLEAGITPMVTIFHWDLPNVLQKLGGWANPLLVDYFTDFARVAYENFGDRVKYWMTLNEAHSFCSAYGKDKKAPVKVDLDGIGEYLCIKTSLLAHAAAYRLYNDSYKATQNGVCGIAVATVWYEPNSTSEADIAAADRVQQFRVGAYTHAIFSEDGDYPAVMKEAVANRSAQEGFPYSRLPDLTSDEIDYIKGTYDFFGLNHYTSNMTSATEQAEIGDPSNELDEMAIVARDPSWNVTAADWFAYVPWGFTKILLWIKEEYNNPPIIVTENGFADTGEIDDQGRVQFYQEYMSAMLDAMDQGVNVIGYTAWSLMDNFEWLYGYEVRFGLYYVNMSDPDRPRTPKSSVEYYKHVISTRKLTNYTSTTGEDESTSAEDETTENPSDSSGSMITISIICLCSFITQLIVNLLI